MKYTILLLAALITSCASVPMATDQEDQRLKQFPDPENNHSGIYIYRDSFVGQALKKSVYLNGKLIGETVNEVYFYKQVPAGKQFLSTESEFSENDLVIKTEPGKNYFIRQIIKFGVFVGGAKLELVPEDLGKANIQSCRLAK